MNQMLLSVQHIRLFWVIYVNVTRQVFACSRGYKEGLF